MRKLTPPIINWKAIPFVRISLPLMLGIFLADRLSIANFSIILLVGLFSYLIFTPKKYRKWIKAGVFINIFFVLFGGVLRYAYLETNAKQHFQQYITQENTFIGIVKSNPKRRKDKIKLELSLQTIHSQKDTPCLGQLLVYIYDTTKATTIKYGDQLILKGRINAITAPKNPYAFNYKRYLFYQNIHYQTFIKASNWKILENNQLSALQQFIHNTRQHYKRIIKKNIPSEAASAITTALLLGYKEDINLDLKRAYSEAGGIHVLAVSGLHVGILSTFFLAFLNFFQWKNSYWKFIKLVLILLLIWIYALLTGLSPSVQRAAVMFSILHIGKGLNRDTNIYNSLAIAAFFILLVNPFALFHIGFQFSFLALIGIVFFTPKLTKFWSPNNKFSFRVWQLLIVGFSAQLAILPLSLFYFHQVPVYFWLTGLFLIPFTAFILYVGFALLIMNAIHTGFASILGYSIFLVITFQNTLIEYIQKLPFHVLTGIWLQPIEVLLAYVFILGVVLILLTQQLRWIKVSLIAFIFLASFKAVKTYQQIGQKKIVFYSIPKSGLIDFMDGQEVFSLMNKQLDEQILKYSVENNRYFAGIKKVNRIEKENIQFANLYKKDNALQFFDKKIIIIKNDLPLLKVNTKPFACNYLIIQNNPSINIADLQKYFSFKEIIFDNTNASKNIEKWKEYCLLKEIPFRNLKNEEAYVVNITNI